MKKFKLLLIITLLVFVWNESGACTSAIITGKLTPDGRALLWKHRDTGEDNNRIEYFKGKKYNFTALVNSPDKGGVIWIGTNSAGFSIMNTASYNLKDDNVKEMDREGELMYDALSECKNIKEFEQFLKKRKKPMGVEANFGVIDSEGGAAYFETNNNSFRKIDANDPAIAPEGYLIYTNYSYTGRFNEGMGYIRYQNARDIVTKKAISRDITPEWIFNSLSRSYYHSQMGINLTDEKFSPERASGWVIDQDFIPRKSSTASVIVQGVKPGENVEMTTMWVVLGYPPAGIAVPVWVKAGEELPSVLVKESDSNINAYACDMALKLKYKTFSLKRGSGGRYMYFPLIYNNSGNGYMQILQNYEKNVLHYSLPLIEKWRKEGLNLKEVQEFNNRADEIVKGAYASLLNL
ncbi:MAG: hypothetical protein PHV12_03885 [Bacteroidales bacterium]|jgi:hypothetical protein|nr:hypothetical protein [Bacteroidales bacterium]MDD3272578.1 hypothetical protein [Bacteroidales bacterium]MDD4058042.1 hypothetical protein [Bacteroidales bacterium]